MKVKLKGVGFFKAGDKGKILREGEALVIHGELEDGRPTTQCISWDTEIEVKASSRVVFRDIGVGPTPVKK